MMEKLNTGFRETCRTMFGADIGDLEEYENWLKKHVPLPQPETSAISGKEIWIPPPKIFLRTKYDKKRIVSFDEIDQIKTNFKKEDLDGINLEKIKKIIEPVAYYVGNYRYGNAYNVEKSSGAGPGENIYYSEEAYLGVKNIAYCNYVLCSEYMFGCENVPESSFCINCYHSNSIKNCFEMEGCKNCSSCMFCHNCEDLQDCIFCFNAKGMRHAVGNIEVGAEEYQRIKKILVNHIINNLKANKKLDVDIFNFGCWKRI